MSQYADLPVSNLDPEFAAVLGSIPMQPMPDDITLLREGVEKWYIPTLHAHFGPLLPADSEYRVENRKIPVEGGEILVHCLVPTPAGKENKANPLFVYCHGGLWLLGNAEMDDHLLKILCVKLQISIVSVDYRLMPEHPYPIGLNDSYAALKWAAEQSALLSISLDKGFLVGGNSAGGNFAAVLANRARDDPFFSSRPLTGQVLHIPCVVHPDAYPEKYKPELLSGKECNDVRFLGLKEVRMYLKLYNGDPADLDVSPLLQASHANLPPALIQVAGLDPFRDEGLLYERLLREAGVKTQLHTYPGLPHGFQVLFPGFKASARFIEDCENGLRWLLNGAPKIM